MAGPDAARRDDRSLTVVSNREPYVHRYDGDDVTVSKPAGGLVTALGDVVAEVGGTWVAWGSGEADFDPDVAPEGRVKLPPEDPAYTLERVDLPRSDVDDYYYGYANQVLWPLCHLDTNYVHVDPDFAPGYRRVNRRFAEAVRETDPDTVWFQDYHLALAPRHVREACPDARLVHFWHIPWPGPEVWEVCPQVTALLEGVTANDALGFHVERYVENFLDTVAAHLPDATVDREAGTVTRDGHTLSVYASPLGVDAERVERAARSDVATHHWERFTDRQGIAADTTVALGVDRLDYTKGIVERLDALDYLWSTRPALRGALTYVQKAARTRERIPSYRQYHSQVRDRIYEINRVHGTDDWTPVVYTEADLDDPELAGLFRNADVGVVSSRRDGLNLVAKEFAAASAGTESTLVLSRFAGAAEALCPDALPVNPYDVAGFADTIERAVEMGRAERAARTRRLVRSVREHDIDRWLADQRAVLAGEPDRNRPSQ